MAGFFLWTKRESDEGNIMFVCASVLSVLLLRSFKIRECLMESVSGWKLCVYPTFSCVEWKLERDNRLIPIN